MESVYVFEEDVDKNKKVRWVYATSLKEAIKKFGCDSYYIGTIGIPSNNKDTYRVRKITYSEVLATVHKK